MNARDPAPTERVVLGRYRLLERLGSGGTAEVWRAHDSRLDREVAVKLLHPHLLPDEQSRRRLQSEAHAAARLAHPGIVAVYDVDAHGDVPVIVLELVEGESLSHRLERVGRIPEREAGGIGVQIADALQHAHDRGLVHRDVKPGNVVLTTDGRVRLVDFGIARSLQESAARLTATGMIVGTLRYLAPEQLLGEEASEASDVYALGAVLYEMLAGRPPHDSPNPVALVEALKTPPPALTGVSPRLARIVLGALSADPTGRPASAAALAAEMRSWLATADPGTDLVPAGALPVPVLAVSPFVGIAPVPDDAGDGEREGDAATELRPAVLAAGAPAAETARAAAPPRRRGRRPGVAIGVAVAGAIVALAVALAVMAPLTRPTDALLPGPTPTETAAPAATPAMELDARPPGEKEDDEDDGRGRGRGNEDRGNEDRGNGNGNGRGGGGDEDD